MSTNIKCLILTLIVVTFFLSVPGVNAQTPTPYCYQGLGYYQNPDEPCDDTCAAVGSTCAGSNWSDTANCDIQKKFNPCITCQASSDTDSPFRLEATLTSCFYNPSPPQDCSVGGNTHRRLCACNISACLIPTPVTIQTTMSTEITDITLTGLISVFGIMLVNIGGIYFVLLFIRKFIHLPNTRTGL